MRSLLAAEEIRIEPPEPDAFAAARLPEILALRGLRVRIQSLARASGGRAPSPEALALYKRILERARAIASEWGGEIAVAYLPRDGRVALGAPTDEKANRVLSAARDVGLATVDLGDALRAQPDPIALYAYPGNTAAGPAHLNATGYRVVADALAKLVRSLDAARTGQAARS